LGGIWVPYFLRENGVKRNLLALYVGITGSGENAKTLINDDISSITADSACGSSLTKKCFVASIRWLKYLQEFSNSPDVFSDQFLEPARSAARFVLRAHKCSPSTTELRGLVFRKSNPFYSRNFEENLVTFSVAIPELGYISSIRCRYDQAKTADFGFFRMRGVQPIPYVNRIHPAVPHRVELKPCGEPSCLADMNLCKVSFGDVDYFTDSLGFEEYCEIWSEQKEQNAVTGPAYDHDRFLGTVGLLGGVIQSAGTGPYIKLRDPCGSELTRELYVTEQLLRLLDTDYAGLSELKGKLVRVLATFWYRYGSAKSTPETPEALALEPVQDRSRLIEDDLIGFVRVRERVSLQSVSAKYPGIDASSLPCPLAIEGLNVFYDSSAKIGDRVIQIFAEEEEAIRSARRRLLAAETGEQGSNPFVIPSRALDTHRLSMTGLAEWMCNANRPLLDCLLTLITKQDSNGCLPSTYREIAVIMRGVSPKSAENFAWLRNLGLILKSRRKPMKITRRGIDVVYNAVRDRLIFHLKEALKKRTLMDLMEIQKETNLAPTLLLKALLELKSEGFASPVLIKGQECQIFWCKSQGQSTCFTEEASTRLEGLKAKVMATLNSTSFVYPLHTSVILEKIQKTGYDLNYLVLHLLLMRLKNDGRVQEQNREVWLYPLETRVIDVLKKDPCQPFTIEEIALRASVAQSIDPSIAHFLLEIQTILNDLKNKGVVEEVLDHWWSYSLPEKYDERKSDMLRHACRKQILAILAGYGNVMKKEKLRYDITNFVDLTKKKAGMAGSSWLVVIETINEMLRKGEIIEKGDCFTSAQQSV
jgi:hypothetical protein